MSTFEQDMEQWEEQWVSGQEREGGTFADLPDGTYQAKVAISRCERKEWGWQWSLRYEEVNGLGGVWANYNLEDEVGAEIAGDVAKRLGFSGKLSQLEQACADGLFDDLLCDIKVVTKAGKDRDYKNAYVNRVHGKAAATKEFVPVPGEDPDIPF